MPPEAVTTTGTAPATPAATGTPATPPAAQTGEKPVGGLEGNGQVATPVSSQPVTPATPEQKATPVVPPPAVPEKYELKLSDGSLLKPEHLDHIVAYAKSKGMSQAQAADLLSREEGTVKSFFDQQKAAHEERIEKWKSDAASDSEIGGEKYGENVEMAKRGLQRFDTDGTLAKELDQTGYGNHPAVLRFFHRIGKAMHAPPMVPPGNAVTGGQKSIEDVFYPKKQT